PEQESLCYIGPDLFHSGYLGARLTSYGTGEGKILVVNISKEIDNHHHLLRKEEGFRAWFADHGKANEIHKIDIRETGYESVAAALSRTFADHPDIRAVLVTNSRISTVAAFAEKRRTRKYLNASNTGQHPVIVIGYDVLETYIEYLEKEIIDFLICQRPDEQGYLRIRNLYQSHVLGHRVEKVHFRPI